MKQLVHEHEYFLTAAECDAAGRMPLTLLVERIIETATEHANILGIGYEDLKQYHIGWVLSRLSIEMKRPPRFNSRYMFKTYINDLNRLYSTRTHELYVENDRGEMEQTGAVRTVWVAIDTAKRTAADLSVIHAEECVRSDSPCPVSPVRLIKPSATLVIMGKYCFRYTDIDINGHVNSVRYLDSILQVRPMEWHLNHDIERFDIIYHHECMWGQEATVGAQYAPMDTDIVDLSVAGETKVSARIKWREKER